MIDGRIPLSAGERPSRRPGARGRSKRRCVKPWRPRSWCRRAFIRTSSSVFAHALLREVAHDSLTRARRIEAHRRIVAAVEGHQTGAAGGPGRWLAHSRREGRAGNKAALYQGSPAERALARGSYAEANRRHARGVEIIRRGDALLRRRRSGRSTSCAPCARSFTPPAERSRKSIASSCAPRSPPGRRRQGADSPRPGRPVGTVLGRGRQCGRGHRRPASAPDRRADGRDLATRIGGVPPRPRLVSDRGLREGKLMSCGAASGFWQASCARSGSAPPARPR